MIMLKKQARTAGDAVEERGPLSQQLQEGGHPCAKSPKEVIFTDSWFFTSTGLRGRGTDLLLMLGLV